MIAQGECGVEEKGHGVTCLHGCRLAINSGDSHMYSFRDSVTIELTLYSIPNFVLNMLHHISVRPFTGSILLRRSI